VPVVSNDASSDPAVSNQSNYLIIKRKQLIDNHSSCLRFCGHEIQGLAALTKRLKTRKSKREQDWNNKLHHHNQKAFYSTIQTRGEGTKQISDPPPEEEVKSFWETLYSEQGKHREDAEWLRKEENEMQNVQNAKWDDISNDKITKACKRLAN